MESTVFFRVAREKVSKYIFGFGLGLDSGIDRSQIDR
jgi:hypothetical protein